MIKKFLFLCFVSVALLVLYRSNSVIAASISIPANPFDCPQLMPPHPDWCKDGKIITRGKDEKGCQLPPLCEKETKSQTYPRYGHADDYSWVSGKLQYNPIEGGCWSIVFSETQKDESNYYGIFALNFERTQQIADYADGNFVVVKGEIKGKKFSMACPPNIYGVSEITNNDPLNIAPAVKKIEIKKDGENGQITIKTDPNNGLSTKTQWVINPDPEKCKPSPCTILTVKKIPGGILIKDGTAEAKTSLSIKMDSEKITVWEGNSEKKIIPPSTAKQSVEGEVINMQLDYCSPSSEQSSKCDNSTPVYKMEVSKNSKFISVIPLRINYNYIVDASTGDVISDTKPWFFKYFSFLFK